MTSPQNPGPTPPTPTLAETNAAANNKANFEEAKNGHAFAGYDGKNHVVEDADYQAARAAFTAAYLAAHRTGRDQSGQPVSGGAPKP